jgi:beta-xylosidase
MESPKLVKRGAYYYLTVAEGGTAGPATGHMIISARSKSLSGPWENSPYNPIIRTTKKSERWWSKGHGTLFEDAKGKWWMVYHAYEKGFYNMGRQTLLQPVEWTKDGWYKVSDGAADNQPIKKPGLTASKSSFSLNDTFDGKKLKPQWKFFGEYDTTRFHFDNNGLVIKAKGNSISNSSPLLCVPADHSYTADIEFVVERNTTAGLVLFYSERASSGILTNNGNILVNINGWQFPAEKSVVTNHVFLRLKNVDNTVDLLYSTDGNKWNKLENSVDITSFNHNAFGGFMAVRIGLCSIGEGTVTVKNFVYNPIK